MEIMDREIIIYTILLTIVIISFVLIGETRPDVYLSISILIYFIYTSISHNIRLRAKLTVLDISLLTVFSVIVVYKILTILEWI